MNEKWEKVEIIIKLISLCMTIVAFFFDHNKYILYIVLTIILVLTSISSIYWIKNYPLENKFKFVRYLFFQSKENKFNIAPKVLLFASLKKKSNPFHVETLNVKYEIIQCENGINSYASWELSGIKNVCVNDFYLYTGIDMGKIKNPEMDVYCGSNLCKVELLYDNIQDSQNDIYLCHWDIPKEAVKKDNRIDKIELKMLQENSFNFVNKEVIYLFPWNYAAKIENINFKISFSCDIKNISMQLFEVGKIPGKSFPYHRSLETIPYTEGKTEYSFNILKEELNMDNLYYILIHQS